MRRLPTGDIAASCRRKGSHKKKEKKRIVPTPCVAPACGSLLKHYCASCKTRMFKGRERWDPLAQTAIFITITYRQHPMSTGSSIYTIKVEPDSVIV